MRLSALLEKPAGRAFLLSNLIAAIYNRGRSHWPSFDDWSGRKEEGWDSSENFRECAMESASTGSVAGSLDRRRIVIGILEHYAAARRSGNSFDFEDVLTAAPITELERSGLRQGLDAIERTIAASQTEGFRFEEQPSRALGRDPSPTEAITEGPFVAEPSTELIADGVARDVRTASHVSPDAHRPVQAPPVHAIPPGTKIGNYEIIELIGRGGMGEVYRVRQRQMKVDRIVALKLIRASWTTSAKSGSLSLAVVRFQVEMMAAARLEHEHLVPVYEVGEHECYPYYTMLLVDGPSLSELLHSGPIRGIKTAALLEPIARAVHAAHCKGIVHRDIKPSNILIDSGGKPYLSDFGLAKPLEQTLTLTQPDAMLGSPPYMSPEQARDSSQVTPASDVYSLGATMYEMLTSRPPFRASDPIETMRQVIDELPVPPRRLNRSVARDLEAICLHCLEKDPNRRFASAQELAEDLGRFLEGRPIRTRPLSPSAHLLRWVRRRPTLAGLLVSLLLTAVVGFAATMLELKHTERERSPPSKQRIGPSNFGAYQDRLAMTTDALAAGKVPLAEQLLTECPERLRGWEWSYLRRLCYEMMPILRGHTGAIYSVAFRPTGGALVTGGRHGQVWIWDTTNPRKSSELEGVPAKVVVLDVAWSLARSGHEQIAAACEDGILRVWTKEDLGWGQPVELTGHKGAINKIAFGPDGARIASAGEDGRILVWHVAAPGAPQVLRADGASVVGLGFSPGGESLASVGDEQLVRLWDSAPPGKAAAWAHFGNSPKRSLSRLSAS